MMCSAYRLKKQGDSRQPGHIPFSVLNHLVVPYRVLNVASWPAHRFLRRKVRWPSTSITLKAIHSFFCFFFLMIHTVKVFSIVNETETDIFLEFFIILYDPGNVGNLISGSSFSKPSLDIWKFLGCIMLKSSMQDFKHDLTSVGYEYNSLMVHTFFTTTFLGNSDENWPFPVLWATAWSSRFADIFNATPWWHYPFCCCSVTQYCPTICDTMNCSMWVFPVLHLLPKVAQTQVHSVSEAIQPPHPLLSPSLLPSIFPSIRAFSNESALLIRWLKYWSFSVSPSNEYAELISFRIDWFVILAV